MKITFSRIRQFSFIALLFFIVGISAVYFYFFQVLNKDLNLQYQLMLENRYVIHNAIDMLFSANQFYLEALKREKGNPLSALELLHRKSDLDLSIFKQYIPEYKQLETLQRHYITAVNFYVKSQEEGDPTVDYRKEAQGKATAIIKSAITQGLVVFEKADVLIAQQFEQQQTKIKHFQYVIVLVSILIFMLTLLFGFIINRLLEKSFGEIAAASRKISEGDFDVTLEVEGNDSVSLLNAAINTMKEKIKYFINREKQEVVKLKTEIERREEAEEKNLYMARHDPLTDLPNRLAFQETLEREIYRARRFDRQFALILFDIDYFKNINDTYGHDVGDLLLKNVADRLKQFCRKEDFVSRLGGDEFAIVITDLVSPTDAGIFSRKLQEILKDQFQFNQIAIDMSVSIGISTFPSSGTSYTELYKHADVALYEAKHAGRNCYKFYSKTFNKQFQYRIDIESSLRSSIINNELYLVFQPIVDMRSGKILGAEVLLRWKHPKKGLISPSEFIPVAESSGLIIEIGKWVINEVLLQIDEWGSRKCFKNFFLTINLSPYQLGDEYTVNQIINTKKKRFGSMIQLNLELTETTLMEKFDTISSNLQLLTNHEFKILVDDFGTGASTLQRLERLPVSTLKIDRSFINKIAENGKNEKIIKMIIVLAKSLGLNLVAEGVETKLQMDFLLSNGCYVAQGFYFYKPILPNELLALLESEK